MKSTITKRDLHWMPEEMAQDVWHMCGWPEALSPAEILAMEGHPLLAVEILARPEVLGDRWLNFCADLLCMSAARVADSLFVDVRPLLRSHMWSEAKEALRRLDRDDVILSPAMLDFFDLLQALSSLAADPKAAWSTSSPLRYETGYTYRPQRDLLRGIFEEGE